MAGIVGGPLRTQQYSSLNWWTHDDVIDAVWRWMSNSAGGSMQQEWSVGGAKRRYGGRDVGRRDAMESSQGTVGDLVLTCVVGVVGAVGRARIGKIVRTEWVGRGATRGYVDCSVVDEFSIEERAELCLFIGTFFRE